MTRRTLIHAAIGLIIALAAAEIGVRIVEDDLPFLSDWPTIETEIKAAQLAELETPPALLIVGTSISEAGIDPQILIDSGIVPSAYNSAFPFFTPQAAEVWLNDFIRPWENLDILLIGVPSIPPDPNDDHLVTGLRESQDKHGLFGGLALWRLRGFAADLDEALRRRRRSAATHLWTPLGHQTVYYERPPTDVGPRSRQLRRMGMDSDNQAALARIVEKALDSGATPIIVVEPTRAVEERIESSASYVDSLEALAIDLGAEFWDMNALEWPDSMFADNNHFNREGTAQYTQAVLQLLSSD